MNNNISKITKISFTMMSSLTINKLSNKSKNNIFSKILILDLLITINFLPFLLFIFIPFQSFYTIF